jgi:hypothetical protein
VTNVSGGTVTAEFPTTNNRPIYLGLVFIVTQTKVAGGITTYSPPIYSTVTTLTPGATPTFTFPANGGTFETDGLHTGYTITTTLYFVAQQRRLVVEDNMIDLALQPLPTTAGNPANPSAITVSTGPLIDQNIFLCKEFIVRRNLIRTKDNRVDPNISQNTGTVAGANCERVLVEHNIIEPAPTNQGAFTVRGPLGYVRTFNNQTNDGSRLRMTYWGATIYRFEDYLYDEADDWLLGF